MKKYIYKLVFISVFATAWFSCSKFLDINDNPNDPTKGTYSSLLTLAEKSIADGLAIGSGTEGGVGTYLSVYMHQMSTREDADQYSVNGSGFYINNAWTDNYVYGLVALDDIIANGTEEEALTYVGVAKILKAYAFSQLVDVFGEVPFSEFNKFSEFKNPKFDDGAAIYDACFALLDEGIANINDDKSIAALKPGAADLIYGGNTANWIKAANTIKLKLYNQVRLVRNVNSEVQALLNNPAGLINSEAESFIFPYGPLGSTDDRHPGFGDYASTQRSNHVSPWFYEILNGYNKFIYEGIADPREPYYIYNQLTESGASPNPTEYRDGGFISIYFGSVGPNRDHSQQNAISLLGIYPVGGRYDDGAGGTANASSGTGAAPYRFITYADRLFIEAELINVGAASGDQKAVFDAGVAAAFSQVDYVIGNFIKPAQTVPALAGSDAVIAYSKAVSDLFDAGSDAKKLEYIMTQKWLSNVGSAADQYTDYRRTGYPLLFDPSNQEMAPGGVVSSNAPDANINIPVQLSNPFQVSLPWPTQELEKNSSAPAQKTPGSAKVFWDN